MKKILSLILAIMMMVTAFSGCSEEKSEENNSKIEIEGEEILSIDYDEILEECKKQYPDTKFTKAIIKDIVIKYAREHKYEPKFSTSGMSSWYSILEFDDNGKVIKNLAYK